MNYSRSLRAAEPASASSIAQGFRLEEMMAGNKNSGRRPEPIALKHLRNPDKYPLPEEEASPDPLLDTGAPDFLSPRAAKVWPKVAEQLRRLNLLSEMDEVALAMYCEAFATWADATKKLRVSGYTIRTHNGLGEHPNVKIAMKAHDRLLVILREFGMSPSSRSKVRAIKAKPKANTFALIAGGKKG